MRIDDFRMELLLFSDGDSAASPVNGKKSERQRELWTLNVSKKIKIARFVEDMFSSEAASQCYSNYFFSERNWKTSQKKQFEFK